MPVPLTYLRMRTLIAVFLNYGTAIVRHGALPDFVGHPCLVGGVEVNTMVRGTPLPFRLPGRIVIVDRC